MAAASADAQELALPEQHQEIVRELRRLVREVAPQAQESIKWAQPVYEQNGPFAYIKAFENHVNFAFWRGVEVDDGRGLLVTRGTKMAHVQLRSVAGLDRELVAGMVRDAVRLNQEKGDPTVSVSAM